MPDPKWLFYHAASMGPTWRGVVDEQLDLLESSGLLAASEGLFSTMCGGERHSRLERLSTHVDYFSCLEVFEFPCLTLIQDLSSRFYGSVFYFHTKGVRTGLETISDWRHMMQYFLVSRWQEAVQKLDEGYDCVGCEPGRMPWSAPRDFFHYAGNFFWARSDFIRRLPPIESLDLNHRELAEAWLGMAGDPNYYVAYRSGIDHNFSMCPRSSYESKGYE